MLFVFAPMEGITDDVFRRVHHRYFPGTDRYYTPFLSPSSRKVFSPKELREVLPENNPGLDLVPQLLTDHAKLFVAGAGVLRDLGYGEVNLNLGCPSGTVTAKGRGAGLLYPERRETLIRFLDEIFEKSPLPISIKTRLGKEDPAEFEALLSLFSRYPVKALTVHPRVRADLYREPVRMEWFRLALEKCPFPVGLSGGIAVAGDLEKRLPASEQRPQAVMLGRGLVADPALILKLKGENPPARQVYAAYAGALFEETASRLGSARNTMFRMKEFWSYFILLFGDRDRLWRQLRSATELSEYQAAVARIFRDLPLLEAAEVNWK